MMTYKEIKEFFERYELFKECLYRILEIDVFNNMRYFIDEIDFIWNKVLRISFYNFEKDKFLSIRIPYQMFDDENVNKDDIKFVDEEKNSYISYEEFKKEIV